jgi:hypothetical protein
MFKTIFHLVISKIVTLVENQIDEIGGQGILVETVLLVGGFGTSKCLYHQLLETHPWNGIEVLHANRP